MKKNQTIDTLRGHLFATLEGLQDKETPMDIERAKAITDVAQVIINSAKAEIDHMRVTGGRGSGFIPYQQPELETQDATRTGDISRPAPGVLVHKLRG